jgi:polysaccharide biosynthesis PFTS motif protein
MINFILAIVVVTKELEKFLGQRIPINIKQKRAYEARHSKEYIQLISRLQAEGTLHVTDPEKNLYSIIQDSIAVICVPLTSPALIAREENIPVCYFSTFEALRIPTEVDYIPVIRSPQGLQDFLQSSLQRSQES